MFRYKLNCSLVFFSFICFFPFQVVGSNNKYKGYLDVEYGLAYNLNTACIISINNLQQLYGFSTTHGVQFNKTFVGFGIGYNHSIRDKENMYPIFSVLRYTLTNSKLKWFAEIRNGIIYDKHWVSKVQYYGTLGCGLNLSKKIHLSCKTSIFSRPSRFFTLNTTFVLGYEF